MLDLSAVSADYGAGAVLARPGGGVTPPATGRPALADAAASSDAANAARRAADWLEAVAQRRDQTAFAALFRSYAPRIKTYLRRLGADAATAEELTQEAMLLVWRKSALFDRQRASAATWIFTIARNVRIDRLRHEFRPEIDPHDPLLAPDAAVPADEQVDTQRRDRQLRSLLQQLPRDQSTVIALSFFEDVPHSEIALRLGLPLGTVKSRLRLALQRIRRLLGEAP
jgi:RNA polymerase sigma-70 factor (ECF subfamily)